MHRINNDLCPSVRTVSAICIFLGKFLPNFKLKIQGFSMEKMAQICQISKAKKLFACRTSRNHEQNQILRFLWKPQKTQDCVHLLWYCRTCRTTTNLYCLQNMQNHEHNQNHVISVQATNEQIVHLLGYCRTCRTTTQKLFCLQNIQNHEQNHSVQATRKTILCRTMSGTRKTSLCRTMQGTRKTSLDKVSDTC